MEGYTYECDDCEDIEFYGEILSNGFYCKCGGNMELVRKDNFVILQDDCDKCVNNKTNFCLDCTRQK